MDEDVKRTIVAADDYHENFERRLREIRRKKSAIDRHYQAKEKILREINSGMSNLELERKKDEIRAIDLVIMRRANQIKMAIRSIIISKIRLETAVRSTSIWTDFKSSILFSYMYSLHLWADGKTIDSVPLEYWLLAGR